MEDSRNIQKTVICEHNSRSSVPFSTVLTSTADLASVTFDLSRSFGGVLLQGIVNWSATFTIPPAVRLEENGFAEVTFQLLRDGQVIYQVTQTLRQKDFEVSDESQTSTAFETASLLYLDTLPVTSPVGGITYTVRAADIALFPQNGIFTSDEPPAVVAAAGVVMLSAKGVDTTYARSVLEDDENGPVLDGLNKIFIDQSIAPMPPTPPFTTLIPGGAMVELARIDVGTDSGKAGIFLTAVVNWGVRVTSNGEPVNIGSSGSANVLFELLRNETVIYRVFQTAVQTFLDKLAGPVETVTFEIADISCLDMPPRGKESGSNTYILRATNITIINPAITDEASVLTTAGVGPVTLVAELIDGDKVKKKSKHRQKRRR